MNTKLIYGIQQIGVGVPDAEAAFKWYATKLGSDVSVFDDDNTATYMAKYMGGKPRKKRAILAMNMQGGSGYEIWQHTEHTPTPPMEKIKVGDLGISSIKIKAKNLQKCYDTLKAKGVTIISDIQPDPDGPNSFYIQDPYDNVIQIKEFSSWYTKKLDIGGIFGCTIGVSDIDESLKLYKDILGYDKVIYDKTDSFDDLKGLNGGGDTFRRVLLGHSQTRVGGFSKLFGESQIELIQTKSRTPVKIFENRYWGDIGFIHLCFDIRNMNALVEEVAAKGFPFQVLSDASFDMGDANGHWGYLEDPDGTLIEFVETHKVPLIKKINWSINLKKREPTKPLPNWLIKAMSFNRVKFDD